MKFSQRMGLTPLSKEMQLDRIDNDLKIGLWNIYDLYILGQISTDFSYEFNTSPSGYFSNSLWHDHFKKPIDEIPDYFPNVRLAIRKYFFGCKWYEVYDLIDFTVDIVEDSRFAINKYKLLEYFDSVLEREFSGYRFIDAKLSPISNPHEIKEIEEAICSTSSFTSSKGCNTHLREALSKLSDRHTPDYRNSIKESISAVESIAKLISANSRDSLSGALDKIKGRIRIHPALERGFKQIYGYTSDSDGIRHALTDEATCDFEDAKFMLVSCSAFINYLSVKSSKAGIAFS